LVVAAVVIGWCRVDVWSVVFNTLLCQQRVAFCGGGFKHVISIPLVSILSTNGLWLG
jgi:hypothetical protein